MRKGIYFAMLGFMLITLSACKTKSTNKDFLDSKNLNDTKSNKAIIAETPLEQGESEKIIRSDEDIDVDLTQLSSTMVYSEVYNMMVTPDDYVGKIVKMKGQFTIYEDPETEAIYYAVLIADAAACCSQGLEFVWKGEHSYPQDYPELGTEITVIGEFQLYEENGYSYCHLTDADLT